MIIVNDGNTALIWAAVRSRIAIISILLQNSADLSITDIHGFTALDHAIINGNYPEALLLKKAGLRHKSIDFYELKKDIFVFYKVNIQEFLDRLEDQCPQMEQVFEKKPPSNHLDNLEQPKLQDPVIDPRESWKDMMWRMSEFKAPPLVQK